MLAELRFFELTPAFNQPLPNLEQANRGHRGYYPQSARTGILTRRHGGLSLAGAIVAGAGFGTCRPDSPGGDIVTTMPANSLSQLSM